MDYTQHRETSMKNNVPVTQIEHALDDKTTLLSTTDKESHITYANSAFVGASRFNEYQLVSESHSITHHPDISPTTFANMWHTLQQGDSWTGMVRNHRQNDDHYWVRANVTPVWYNEKLTGCVSMRTVSSYDEITRSENLYQKINNQQLKGFRLFKGIIIRRGILSWASMFRWLSISQRVNYSLGITALLIVLFFLTPVNPFIQAGGLLFLSLMFAIYLKYQICQSVNTLLMQMKKVVSGRKPDNHHLNRVDEVGILMHLANQSGSSLNPLVDDVSMQISGTRVISQRISEEGTALHKRSEEASAGLQQTAATIGEIGNAAQRTAKTTAHTITMINKTNVNAIEGGDIMKQTIAMVQAMSRNNGQIVDIISVIDNIAFRTNILAFNTTAEIAQAGEFGRGFVVVAAEARNLAQYPVPAAKEIKQLTEKNIANTNSGVKMVEQTETHLTGMTGDVLQISMMIGGTSLATREQTQVLDLINDSISRVSTMAHNSAKVVERVIDVTASLAQRSSCLQQAAQVFGVSA